MKNIILIPLSIFFIIGCNKKSTSENTISTQKSDTIDPKNEIQVWKSELLNQKLIGKSCNYESVLGKEAEKWTSENQNLYDGLPSDTAIHIGKSDFDNDTKPDIILYFISQNCTGHNGGTPSFAKIIYANGKSDAAIMTKIYDAILIEYNKKRDIDKNLKQISNAYLKESITITFDDSIHGQCSIYAQDDAHCCPSYTGAYIYNAVSNRLELDINESEK